MNKFSENFVWLLIVLGLYFLFGAYRENSLSDIGSSLDKKHVLTQKPLKTRAERYQDKLNDLKNAKNDLNKFYALGDIAKIGFELEHYEISKASAHQLLELAPNYPNNWNYGNAIHDSHLVLGRLALKDGDVSAAKEHLLKSTENKGSPTMNSFGPNMSLAKDLLLKGESEVVLEYFDRCRKFWKNDHGKLDSWTESIRSGKIPKFKANLLLKMKS